MWFSGISICWFDPKILRAIGRNNCLCHSTTRVHSDQILYCISCILISFQGVYTWGHHYQIGRSGTNYVPGRVSSIPSGGTIIKVSMMLLITVTSSWPRWCSNHRCGDCNCFGQAQIKEDMKALRQWPLLGEFTGDRRISRTKGQ